MPGRGIGGGLTTLWCEWGYECVYMCTCVCVSIPVCVYVCVCTRVYVCVWASHPRNVCRVEASVGDADTSKEPIFLNISKKTVNRIIQKLLLNKIHIIPNFFFNSSSSLFVPFVIICSTHYMWINIGVC